MQNVLRTNLSRVRERMQKAAVAAGRDVAEIKLVAVSKTHPVEAISQALEAGITTFGENKVQEAESKITEVGRQNAEWHLIGHLQSNKARRAVQVFDVIHSVDSVDLATRLERICVEDDRAALRVFVQVDLAREQTKSGISEENLPALVNYLRLCRRVKFEGLMILPPFFDNTDDVRPFFRRLRTLRDDLATQGAFGGGRGELSMGMSHDLEIAIEEGATVVRVGTAIFGDREEQGTT